MQLHSFGSNNTNNLAVNKKKHIYTMDHHGSLNQTKLNISLNHHSRPLIFGKFITISILVGFEHPFQHALNQSGESTSSPINKRSSNSA